jgi:hypothetical protein
MMTGALRGRDARPVSVTAAVVIPEGGVPPVDRDPVVDSVVARLHAEFGIDPVHLRRLAVEALGTFATARVRTFVPILVEKRVRRTCRELTPRDR